MAEYEFYPPKGRTPVQTAVDHLLHETPSYRHLDAGTQAALRDSLTKVAGYLADNRALAGQMAGVDSLRSQLGAGTDPSQPTPASNAPGNGAVTAPSTPGGSGSGGVGGSGGSATAARAGRYGTQLAPAGAAQAGQSV